MVLIFLFLGCLVFTTALTPEACKPCTCVDKPPHLTVDCSSLGLINPPTGLPSNLTTLLLNNNLLRHINKTYLERFPQISFLSLSENTHLGLDNASEAFFGLRNSNISVINASVITQEYSYKECIKLKPAFFRYLRETPLKSLYLDKNRILLVEPGTLQETPPSLEIFSMRKSRLVMGPTFLEQFEYLSNVRKFDLSQRNFEEKIFRKSLTGDSSRDYQKSIRKRRNVEKLESLSIRIPPKLEEVIFDSCYFKTDIPNLRFQNNSLKIVILCKNLLDPVIGPVYGLDNLEELDLSENNCYNFSSSLSRNFPAPKLRKLNLKRNNLDLSNHEHIFEHWVRLTTLDLSYNKISVMPTAVFAKLTLLEYIFLGGNIIYEIGIKLEHMNNLLLLDISQNQIAIIPQNTTNQLDLIRDMSNLSLDLTGNPIRCSCSPSSLHFIRWLMTTKVNIINILTLTCVTDDEGINTIGKYRNELESQCSSPAMYYGLAMGASVACTGCMSFIIMGLLYRYRFKITYACFVRFVPRHPSSDTDRFEHTYDAYIAYVDDDRDFAVHMFRLKLETEHQIRLCFRHRDFLPGEATARSIVSAIQESRRVVLVLSPNFLKSGWRRYEFEMAQCESIERAHRMIVLVKYKDYPLSDLSKDMLRMLQTQRYLEFPETDEDQQTFWETLKYILSDS